MPFRVYCNSRRIARELRKLYRLRFPELALINAQYCRQDGLSGLALAKELARKNKLVVICGQPPDEDAALVAQLQTMPNVRFLNNPLDEKGIRQAYNDLRTPWLPHNVPPRRDRRYTRPKTRD